MQVQFNTSTMHLEDMPLDIGYASEQVSLKDSDGKPCIIGGHNGKTQLIISAPFIDSAFLEELKVIHEMIPQGGEYEVSAALVVANDTHEKVDLEKFDYLIDSEGEFGDFYGVRLKGTPCEGELTKAIILISKDGAIFYDEFAKNLHDKFNTDTLFRKIYAAQTCYTGKGCH